MIALYLRKITARRKRKPPMPMEITFGMEWTPEQVERFQAEWAAVTRHQSPRRW